MQRLLRHTQNDRGSMPLALVLVMFVLIMATIATATLAWQVNGNRAESTARNAAWELDTTLNQGAQTLGSASATLSGMPLAAPTTWTHQTGSDYYSRWWLDAGISAIAVNGLENTSCAVITGGTVSCWGAGVAVGGTFDGTSTSLTPQQIPGISNAVGVAVGSNFACAQLDNGQISCWGDNTYGQLGRTTTATTGNPAAVVPNITTTVDIGAGHSNACAVLADGTAVCWGRNQSGQLGNGTTTNSIVPVTVTGLTGATRIEADDTTCAITTGGIVKCWGAGTNGQLGNGTNSNSSTPVTATGLSGVSQILAGTTPCALTTNQGVYCWGKTLLPIPARVNNQPANINSISGTGNTHCLTTTSGRAYCWGDNTYGQLGNGNTTNANTPQLVTAVPSGIASMSGSLYASCATLTNGTLKCWGAGTNGQLGNGAGQTSSTAVAVTGITGSTGRVVLNAQVKLAGNPGAGLSANDTSYKAQTFYAYNPVTATWQITGYQANAN